MLNSATNEVRLECKSWLSFSPRYYSRTIKEFVTDLKDVVALDRMQWVFDGKGLFTRNARGRAYLKEQFIRMLQTQEGKDALQVLVDNEKLKSLVPVDVVINDVSDFINYLSRDDVFNKIFK